MGKMSIADKFNMAYKEIVNDNKISDELANSQAREYIESRCEKLDIAVTEFLATLMAVKPNVKINFRDIENDGVILDCAYDDVIRMLIFSETGRIIFDKSHTENSKEKQ